MTVALVQINPLAVLDAALDTSVPVVLPDGRQLCGVAAGWTDGVYTVATVGASTPPAPNRFYTQTGATPALNGATLTWALAWTALPLAPVQKQLIVALNEAAERLRLQYITPGTGQALVYQQKLAEAAALARDPAPVAANYPLLNAGVRVEAPDLASAGALVQKSATAWASAAASIEAARVAGKAKIGAATTVDAALAAYDAAIAALPVPSS